MYQPLYDESDEYEDGTYHPIEQMCLQNLQLFVSASRKWKKRLGSLCMFFTTNRSGDVH